MTEASKYALLVTLVLVWLSGSAVLLGFGLLLTFFLSAKTGPAAKQ